MHLCNFPKMEFRKKNNIVKLSSEFAQCGLLFHFHTKEKLAHKTRFDVRFTQVSKRNI